MNSSGFISGIAASAKRLVDNQRLWGALRPAIVGPLCVLSVRVCRSVSARIVLKIEARLRLGRALLPVAAQYHLRAWCARRMEPSPPAGRSSPYVELHLRSPRVFII